jgi:coproporphyrinogen III oxidase
MAQPDEIQASFRSIQNTITEALAEADGTPYLEDRWDYAKGSGGGVTRVWENATLLEKGGVNFSAIHGDALPESAATQFKIAPKTPFLATGVSLVIHPWNPYIPTIHMNIRYFEAGDVWWFGGGIDLTPYIPNRDEVVAFHAALREVCDRHNRDYAEMKSTCDTYFTIPHRNEMRGVGGIFYDHLQDDKNQAFAFTTDLGKAFPGIYIPLIEANKDRPYTDHERDFQLYRRGRYVEFNLVHDRGTKFGLQSSGRIESILMSMPATAQWRYNWTPEPDSPEEELTQNFLQPRDWLGEE